MKLYEVTVTITYGISAESSAKAKQAVIAKDFDIEGHAVLMVDYDYDVRECEEEG